LIKDVVYMLNGLGVETGIDLDRLVDASEFVCGLIGQKSRSRAGTALAARRASAGG
jgi:hydroxymethylglutaryl-CoA lyase